MYPIFYPSEPLKGRDLLWVSGIIAVLMAIITFVTLLVADADVACIFGVLTALDLVVVGYAYYDVRKEKAKKQEAPKN